MNGDTYADEMLRVLRRDLGLRPETRTDVIIHTDGTCDILQEDGTFKRVEL